MDGDSTLTTINLRFPGQYYDAETRLHYNWNRYYDPALGRYVTSDPVGLYGGLNLYLYANGNTIRFVDQDGLRPTKNPKGPDGRPRPKRGCREECVLNFIGTGALASGVGVGTGFIFKGITAKVIAHFRGGVVSGLGYFSLGTCLRKCDENDGICSLKK